MLLDFIRSTAARQKSLLDVGGGIGTIQHELAQWIQGPITSVDASSAYLSTAMSESQRRGYSERVSYVSGDFIDEVDELPDADIVTMDRVICCYPNVEALLSAAARKSKHAIGLVFPREEVYVRFGTRLVNLVLRLMRSDFRTFVHPHAKVEQILAREGFRSAGEDQTILWRVALFVQTGTPKMRPAVAGQ